MQTSEQLTEVREAHRFDEEALDRYLAALAATDVPVPKVYLLCETDDPIGTPFFIGNRKNNLRFRNVR